jgi:hypothetical protein
VVEIRIPSQERKTPATSLSPNTGIRSAESSPGSTGWFFARNLALNQDAGRKGYLWANGIAWKDYAQPVSQVSQRVKQASLAGVEAGHRPVGYLPSGKESKEEMARAIARQDGITRGPVCAFTAVEPCLSVPIGDGGNPSPSGEARSARWSQLRP